MKIGKLKELLGGRVAFFFISGFPIDGRPSWEEGSAGRKSFCLWSRNPWIIPPNGSRVRCSVEWMLRMKCIRRKLRSERRVNTPPSICIFLERGVSGHLIWFNMLSAFPKKFCLVDCWLKCSVRNLSMFLKVCQCTISIWYGSWNRTLKDRGSQLVFMTFWYFSQHFFLNGIRDSSHAHLLASVN